eukprot:3255606-Pyramimonas_sp.AAC.1
MCLKISTAKHATCNGLATTSSGWPRIQHCFLEGTSGRYIQAGVPFAQNDKPKDNNISNSINSSCL